MGSWTNRQWVESTAAELARRRKAASQLEVVKDPALPVSLEEKEAWCQFLRSANVDENLWHEVLGCSATYWWETCSKKGAEHIVKKHYDKCNNRPFCPICAWYQAQLESRATYEFLGKNVVRCVPFKVYSNHIVLTLPHSLDGIEPKELVMMKDELLRKDEVLTFDIHGVQERSSENPFLPHKHIHVYTLNVGLVKNDLGSWTIHRMDPWFNVDALRERWTKIVNSRLARFGLQPVKDTDVEVSYAKFSSAGKNINWLRYLYRYECWDVFKFIVRGKGAEPLYVHTMPLGLDLEALLQEKPRVAWSGYLANSIRYKWLKVFNEDVERLEEVRERLRDEERHCPVCGADMVRMPADWDPPPGVDQLSYGEEP